MHRVRRALGVGASVAAVVGLLAGVATPAGAVEDVQTERVAGNDRFATAAAIAAEGWPEGSPTVVVASGRAFPDALAGAAIGLPILLTDPNALPSATADAIDDLGATNAFLLGGTAAVSPAVEAELAEQVDVVRIAGQDRYETAAEIAEAIGADDVAEVDGLRTALIATGLQFADALAGGPIASGVTGGSMPVLLVGSDVPDATSDALEALDIEQVILLGGTAAVSPSVQDQLETQTGNDAVRLAGANRFATATAIADFAVETLDFAGDEVLLANGLVFADALAGGPLGGQMGAPLLLTEANQLSSDTATWLEENNETVETITTLGGTAAVSEGTVDDAETSAELTTDDTDGDANETIAVTPEDDVVQANGTTREYTVSGLTSGVDIVLVRCALVSSSGGNTVFFNSNGGTLADGTASGGSSPDRADTPAYISSVNGTARMESGPAAPANNDYAGSVAPSAGTVTFSVTGPSGASASSSCVVPVVFDDANSDNALNVPPSGSPVAPTEAFGTGGSVTFSSAAAGAGQFSSRDVADNAEASNTFNACVIVESDTNPITGAETEVVDTDDCSTYSYDSNDIFQIASQPVDLATFEARLSGDDDVSGTYFDNPTGRSTFNLVSDEGPRAVSGAAENPAATTSNGTTITFGESPTPTTDSYRLVRVPAPATGTCVVNGTGAASVGTAADPTPGEYDATTLVSITDSTATASTDYCYFVIPVDDLDDGIPSSAVEVTTDSGPSATAPIITSATGRSGNSTLSADDQHQLVFSEAMSPATADGSYQVTSGSNPLPVTIACSGASQNADCTLSASGTTLRVTITGTFLTAPTYPLTISSTTGMTDTTNEPVNLAATNDDQVIEATSLTEDTTNPSIQSADMSTDADGDGFNDGGDALDLVFNEEIVLNDADGILTFAQVRAITGDPDLGYSTEGAVTGQVVNGTTLRLTVVPTASLTNGIAIGAVVDGTSNSNVIDGFSRPQIANPNANPVLTA